MNNCSNIKFFYSCKYLPKYASEINYVFSKLREFDHINVLSLGCGPCTDFFGINNAIISYRNPTQFSYNGIEMSREWEPCHLWISQQTRHQFNINYADIFDVLNTPNLYLNGFSPNFIIINYLLSSLINENQDINRFINLLVTYFNTLRPNSFILINDINLGRTINEPRFYYQIIDNQIINHNQTMLVRMHFRHNYNLYFQYGFQHDLNTILYIIPDNLNIFNPWRFCSSAQIIIKKVA